MGRTVLPYSQVLEREYQDWKKFRRGLRREDQAVLDRLFDLARLHVHAGAYASRPWPLETVLISILIEQEKALDDFRRRVQGLEESLGSGKPSAVGGGASEHGIKKTKGETVMMKRIAVFENRFQDEALSTFLVHESPYIKVMNFNLRAGQSLPIHAHDIEGEVSIVVLEGQGLFLAKEDKTLPASPGDVLICDISEPHGVRAETDMRVLALIAPPI